MNEIQNAKEFDYSIVDAETEAFLVEKYYVLEGIHKKYSHEVGRVFQQVQEKLAKKGYGCFGEWIETTGFSRSKVYSYIQQYSFVQQLDIQKKEVFEELPVRVKAEMAKPSAHKKINQMVYDGDITTHKEYKEQEKIIKEQEKTIEEQQKIINEQAKQKPEVIEIEIPKEIVPHDYENLKSDNQQLIEALKEAQENESRAKQEKERFERESQIKRKIENDDMEQAQLMRLQRNADINVHKLIINMNDFVKEQSITVYDSEAIAGASGETKEKLNQSIKRVENLLKDIKQEIGGNVVWRIN